MIYLRKGQTLADNPGMVVYENTGYYNDGDSIICASVTAPEEPVCRYEAKFVAYGGLVYSISDPDELLEQVLKLDPNSLFGKTSKQVAVDNAVDQIVPQMPGAILDEPATGTSTPATDIPQNTQTSTTTPPVITTPNTQTSTTTPPLVLPDTGTSTTTPPFSTSTPPLVLPDIGTSTTTPPLTTSTTTPPITVSTTTPDFTPPPVDVSSTTPSVVISTTTPPVDVSSTTPAVAPIVVPPALEVPTDTSTTTSEVVAFAKKLVKKRISKGLGL